MANRLNIYAHTIEELTKELQEIDCKSNRLVRVKKCLKEKLIEQEREAKLKPLYNYFDNYVEKYLKDHLTQQQIAWYRFNIRRGAYNSISKLARTLRSIRKNLTNKEK